MVEGYCSKCKARREIIHGAEETMSSGRVVFKGLCGSCGDEVVKIMGDSRAAVRAGLRGVGDRAG